MIGIVVDSNSQMPPALAQRYGIEVVPLTVTVDGRDHLEGVDLDADEFYAAWANGHVPVVQTSQPSPGRFVAAYERLAAAGATKIVSIHVTESMSGTLNAARLAAGTVDVDVLLVDSSTASFGISCCAWAAADAIVSGADAETAAATARGRASSLHSTFVVGVPSLIDGSGRARGLGVESSAAEGVPVLAMDGPEMSVLTVASDLNVAVEAMVEDALARPPAHTDGLRICIGTSDASSAPMSSRLTTALDGHSAVAEVIQYRIGPSVGAHTGPGTAGLFVF